MKFLRNKKLILLSIFILHIFYFNQDTAFAGNLLNSLSAEFMLQNTNMGTNFFIAIPQNDVKGGEQEEILAIYVCSFTDTRVKLFHRGLNIVSYRDVKAFKPVVFSSLRGELSFAYEVTESEVVRTQGIQISADDPISVFVLNSRNNTSDGFLAVPTESWGNKYIHCGFYDHGETDMRRAGGFIILASHDETDVTIQLKGTGAELGQTFGKRKLGEVIKVTLDEGETYMVKGDARNLYGFDLTGTTITSTNPIGVISFHQRTMIPNQCNNGRDHLSEMLLPVQTWGKEFVTLAFDRGKQGDLIRIVASEDNTEVTGVSYQSGIGNILEYFSKSLNAGEFFEHRNTTCSENNTQNGVRGVTVWKVNKPAMLMQYAYSFPWDNDQRWDPLMVVVPPVEQFQKSIVFQPAVESDFLHNQLTFFAIGDPDDYEKKLQKSIVMDNEKMSDIFPMILYNKIPTTNIYWGRITLSNDAHNITSDTKISGYINGFSSFNSYAWPLLVGTDKIDELDTLAPEFMINNEDCGNFTISAAEQRNIYINNGKQIDQGLKRIILLKDISSNYSLALDNPDKFIPEKGIYEQKFFLNIINPKEDAKAYFGIVDRAGNYVVDSVYYDAPNLNSSSPKLEFGKSRQNTKLSKQIILTNSEKDSILIEQINLQKSNIFKIVSILPEGLPIKLQYGESATISIEFNPIAEYTYDDSLIIQSTCYRAGYPIAGTGVLPKITVEDWFAGSIEVGRKVCYENVYGQGMRITNPGTDTLVINSFENVTEPFSISDPCNPELPISIAPLGEVYLESVCYHPLDTGSYRNDVVIRSNAGNDDTISIWRGMAYTKVLVEENLDNSDFSFKVLPNPAFNGKFELQFTLLGNSDVNISLYDNDGKLLDEILKRKLQAGLHKVDYQVKNLGTGIYFISLKQGNSNVMQKIIVSH